MALRDILAAIARLVGRKPPSIRLPRPALYPIAVVAETWAWLTHGAEPQITVDGLKMSRKRMFFDPARARRELGYGARPASEAIADAVAWFRDAR